MEDKHTNQISSSSPPSPTSLPPCSAADVVDLELEHTSERNIAGSDNALLIQSLTGPVQSPKAKTLAEPGITEESVVSNLRPPSSLHVLAHKETPPISTTTSSRSKVSTDSYLSAAVDKEPALLSSSTPSFSNTDTKVRDFITHPLLVAVDVPEEIASPSSKVPGSFEASPEEARLSSIASSEPQVTDIIKHNGPLTTLSSRRSSLDSVRSIRPALIPQGLGSVHRRVSGSSIKSASSEKHLALPRYLGSYHGSNAYSRLSRAVSSPAVVSNRGNHPPRNSFSLSRITEGRPRASSPLLIDIQGPIGSDIQFPGDHSPEVISASSDPANLRKMPLFVPRRIQRRDSLMNSSMEATASDEWPIGPEVINADGESIVRRQEFSRSPPPPTNPPPPPPSRLRLFWGSVKRFFRHH